MAVKTQQEVMVDLMSQLVQRLEKLESCELGPIEVQTAKQRSLLKTSSSRVSDTNPIICFKCRQEGHYQQGWTRRSPQGNRQPSV